MGIAVRSRWRASRFNALHVFDRGIFQGVRNPLFGMTKPEAKLLRRLVKARLNPAEGLNEWIEVGTFGSSMRTVRTFEKLGIVEARGAGAMGQLTEARLIAPEDSE